MGLFEIQDEGSQIISEMIEINPGDKIIDFCAGTGGKALSMSSKLENKGVLIVHDINSYKIKEAKKRFKKLNLANVEFHDSLKKLKKFKFGFDSVIIDAPCSGIFKKELEEFEEVPKLNLLLEKMIFLK